MSWFSGQLLQTSDRVAGDYETILVGAEAVGFTPSKIKPVSGLYEGLSAQAVLITLEGGDIRFRLDGGLPTADNGHYLSSGSSLLLTGTQSLSYFLAIRAGEFQGLLRMTYFY